MQAVQQVEIDGQDFKRAMEGAKSHIERHIDELNELNVFPVPDGDTGINMFMTMRSAVRAVEDSPEISVGKVSKMAARGALLGARGNSGVILSQILRGISKGIGDRKKISPHDWAQALKIGSDEAYRLVVDPVEGTILTVIREVSEAASRMTERKVGFTRVVVSLATQARKTVKKTPELLPVLKQAGVVDAGAKGLMYFFVGVKESVCRKTSSSRARPDVSPRVA